jgi:hypothetical protein
MALILNLSLLSPEFKYSAFSNDFQIILQVFSSNKKEGIMFLKLEGVFSVSTFGDFPSR